MKGEYRIVGFTGPMEFEGVKYQKIWLRAENETEVIKVSAPSNLDLSKFLDQNCMLSLSVSADGKLKVLSVS